MNKTQALTVREKTLYHQIHPFKLAADWGSTPLGLYYFWRHKPIAALAITFGPAIIASWTVMRFVNLEPYRESSFGLYIGKYMTPTMQLLRLAGFGIMSVGAWFHRVWLISTGFAVVLFAWLRGVLFPKQSLQE